MSGIRCVMALEYLRQENERLREQVASLKRYEDAIDKCEGGCLRGVVRGWRIEDTMTLPAKIAGNDIPCQCPIRENGGVSDRTR